MEYQQIAYDVDDRVLTITLDRPKVLNAFTARMMHELIDAFDRADADDDIRAVIVTGRGRGFCAGADLSAGGATFDHRSADTENMTPPHPKDIPRDGGGQVVLRIFECIKPVIAAINGPAVGVGITMTLPMDIRMAADSARIGFVFSRRGIVPEACSSWFLPRLVGISRAAEWVYSGRVFPAAEGCDAGLIRSVHSPDALLPAARAIAAEIAEHTSGLSVAVSRQMLWRMLGASHPMEAHRADSRALFELGHMADAQEGVESFLEKRAPHFRLSPAADRPDIFPGSTPPTFQ